MNNVEFYRYPDRAVTYGTFGTKLNPFLPTYPGGRLIDDFHAYLHDCPMKGHLVDLGVPGWLLRADALKIYEMAYFSEGDILEFGTNRGLSSYIIAQAIINSGRPRRLITMELSPQASKQAKKNLNDKGVDNVVDIITGDANETCLALIGSGQKFNFAFVDHSHAYAPMTDACDRLVALMNAGAFVLFHDYNDKRNVPPSGGDDPNEYGVFAAVERRLPSAFEFIGVFGCSGLFYRAI